MKSLLIFSVIIFLSSASFSQTDNSSEEVFKVVEVQPDFKGAMKGFFKYISKNLKYPEDAREQGIEGKVLVMFLIDENGSIPDESVKIQEGIYPSIDQEAIRLIRESPDWIPARTTIDGLPAKVRMILPITFKLSSKKRKKDK